MELCYRAHHSNKRISKLSCYHDNNLFMFLLIRYFIHINVDAYLGIFFSIKFFFYYLDGSVDSVALNN